MGQGVEDWKRYESQLEALGHLGYNYDDTHKETFTDRLGWKVDQYGSHLEDEPPGEPLLDGPFVRAKDILQAYRFPPPSIIKGIFRPELALEGRNMLLRARFMGFTFYFGARVNKVYDEIRRHADQGPYRAWGYSYRTLKGHFEMGEIRFELAKYLETGRIEFHINAYSKPDQIPQLLYRIGFRMFGRSLQRVFAHESMHRLKRMVKQGGPPPPLHIEEPKQFF